jgi:hypothetical protein
MTPALRAAADPSVPTRDHFALFAAGMGFPSPADWDEEREAEAARLRRLPPPWGVGLDPRPLTVRTVVVTGGARALYDETASALNNLGADVRVLAGAGHRVQDDPRTTALLREVWTG